MQVIENLSGSYIGGVFWKAATFTNTDHKIGVSAPCALLLNYKTPDSVMVHISDPPRKSKQIKFSIQGEYVGKGASYDSNKGLTSITLTMPTGNVSGKYSKYIIDCKIPHGKCFRKVQVTWHDVFETGEWKCSWSCSAIWKK